MIRRDPLHKHEHPPLCPAGGKHQHQPHSRYLYLRIWPLSHPSLKCRRRWLVGWWWWWLWVMTVLGFYYKTPVLGKQKTKQSDDRWGTRAEWSVTPRTWEIRVDLLWCGCLEPYLTLLISSDIKTYLPHNLDDVWHSDTLIGPVTLSTGGDNWRWDGKSLEFPQYSEKEPSAFYWAAVVKMNFARMRCFWLTLKFILNVDISCENFASFCR